MTLYETIKATRAAGGKPGLQTLKDAVVQQETIASDALKAYARATAGLVTTQKDTPFPTSDAKKVVGETALAMEEATRRLSKLYRWLHSAETGEPE